MKTAAMKLSVRWIVCALLVCASTAWAVKPGEWVHQTEADFQNAELDHTVVTNLGRVELSRASEKLAELEEEQTIIYDLAQLADGTLYVAIGPEGKIGKVNAEGKVEIVFEFEGHQVFALAADGNTLWAAVSGAESRLDKIEEGKITGTIALKETRYVWDMILHDGKIWVATGIEGKVLHVNPAEPDAEPAVALDSGQKNILCLGIDNKGQIYAGTDGEGLVYRIVAKAGDIDNPYSTFAVYDADEPEIGAILVKADGKVYIGTADAQQARPGRLSEAVNEEKGQADPDKKASEDGGIGDGGDGDGGDGDKEPPAPPKNPQPKPEPLPSDADGGEVGDGDDPAEQAQPEVPAKPSAEQYAQLRKEVSRRLLEARKGQKLQANTGPGGKRLSPRRNGNGTRSGGAAGQAKSGNAVYEISTDGFVREVFRESVMILKLGLVDGKLIVTTGNEGQVYRVDPDAEEITVLADLDVQQIPAMLLIDGQVTIGTANPARLVRLGAGFADTGSFTSDPLDATQPSMWGALQVLAELPEGARVRVQTRSGNLSDPEDGHWSDWSDEIEVTPDAPGLPVYVNVHSPTARYLQYRLTLGSDGKATPNVSRVAMRYLVPNMAPKINKLKAEYAKANRKNNAEPGPPPSVMVNVTWETADANDDKLKFSLETRKLGTDQPFIELEEEIDGNNYEWDTRSMPDGRYVLRLTASDEPDNVPDQVKQTRRVSAQVVVDNSSPAFGQINAAIGANGQVKVSTEVKDGMSVIADFRYSVNGKKDWKAVLPVDMIFDSTNEQMSFSIPDLSPGTHVITLRVADAMGNVRFASVTAQVPAK